MENIPQISTKEVQNSPQISHNFSLGLDQTDENENVIPIPESEIELDPNELLATKCNKCGCIVSSPATFIIHRQKIICRDCAIPTDNLIPQYCDTCHTSKLIDTPRVVMACQDCQRLEINKELEKSQRTVSQFSVRLYNGVQRTGNMRDVCVDLLHDFWKSNPELMDSDFLSMNYSQRLELINYLKELQSKLKGAELGLKERQRAEEATWDGLTERVEKGLSTKYDKTHMKTNEVQLTSLEKAMQKYLKLGFSQEKALRMAKLAEGID